MDKDLFELDKLDHLIKLGQTCPNFSKYVQTSPNLFKHVLAKHVIVNHGFDMVSILF